MRVMTAHMKYTYLKRGVVGILAAWAVTATIALIRMEPKVVTIGIDQNGTRVITQQNDPLLQSEVVNFLRYFTNLYYTYESQTFMEQVGNATGLMTLELWQKKEPEIMGLNEKLKKEPLQSISTLEKITKRDDGSFSATLIVTVKTRLVSDSRKLEVSLKLKPSARTEKNPWAMEVESLEEKLF